MADTDIEEVKATETTYVWQPVMLVVSRRVECGVCQAKAIFVLLDEPEEYNDLQQRPDSDEIEWGYRAYCQDCWQRETEGDNGPE